MCLLLFLLYKLGYFTNKYVRSFVHVSVYLYIFKSSGGVFSRLGHILLSD